MLGYQTGIECARLWLEWIHYKPARWRNGRFLAAAIRRAAIGDRSYLQSPFEFRKAEIDRRERDAQADKERYCPKPTYRPREEPSPADTWTPPAEWAPTWETFREVCKGIDKLRFQRSCVEGRLADGVLEIHCASMFGKRWEDLRKELLAACRARDPAFPDLQVCPDLKATKPSEVPRDPA